MAVPVSLPASPPRTALDRAADAFPDGEVAAACDIGDHADLKRRYAVALRHDAAGGEYLVLADGGFRQHLANYRGEAQLDCHDAAAVERLNQAIAESEGPQGRIDAEAGVPVVCGFINPTEAACWRYRQEEAAFVPAGGWIP